MRFLQLCFLMMVFGISAKAQERSGCLYHILFYELQWDYCNTEMHVQYSDLNGKPTRDTVVFHAENDPDEFTLKYPFKNYFGEHPFIVTTDDTYKRCEIRGFHITVIHSHDAGIDCDFTENNLSVASAVDLDSCKPKDQIIISKIKIFDPILQKEIEIPGVKIYVE